MTEYPFVRAELGIVRGHPTEDYIYKDSLMFWKYLRGMSKIAFNFTNSLVLKEYIDRCNNDYLF